MAGHAGPLMMNSAFRRARVALVVFVAAGGHVASAATLDASILPAVQAATFEVVAAKPVDDPLTYEKPLPTESIPFQERNDKYYSVGTAFAIGNNRFVTAAHVILISINGLWGAPALRDANGKTFTIDKVEKFSLERDFVEFTVTDAPSAPPLKTNTQPALNAEVFAVGNALGTGVIVRDGLYTSSTPEEQDGRWKWMRFSAAASPGNSGGPLIDKDGAVIGVVLRKSPNENLNYALPIDEVLKAPDNTADIDTRTTYRLDVFDTTSMTTFKSTFKLPLSFKDFSREFYNAEAAFADGALKTLLAKDADTLFPKGPGSARILHNTPRMEGFPALITRGDDGNWNWNGKSQSKTQLSGDGFVESGVVGRNLLFYVHVPENALPAQLHGDPQKLAETLLKTGFVKRPIGAEKVRVTGLGKPRDDTTFVDAWQRPWQLRIWKLPYISFLLVTISLPTPDGAVTLVRFAPAYQEHDHVIDLKAMADFVAISYHGTLPQWKSFLAESKRLPPVVASVKLDWDAGKQLRLDTKRIGFVVPNSLQAVDDGNLLGLGLNQFDENGKVVWDITDVQIRRNNADRDRVNVQRRVAPADNQEDTFKNTWSKIQKREHPFDGVSRMASDDSEATAVVETAAHAPNVLYTGFVALPGARDAELMKGKLAQLMSGLTIKEP
jgi:serine protease Do